MKKSTRNVLIIGAIFAWWARSKSDGEKALQAIDEAGAPTAPYGTTVPGQGYHDPRLFTQQQPGMPMWTLIEIAAPQRARPSSSPGWALPAPVPGSPGVPPAPTKPPVAAPPPWGLHHKNDAREALLKSLQR